ncbi:hemerythrin domain-containing protein [Nocardia sp. alder85J]|uniref:hemerythrin domain-containing protein n=1 Tax=Nocardia sp. alder85J TaxID=2862949 RepID=UPI001CD6C572|nr:hemerythrin domain-containing protein [Nocardia sp. alder85J]MCX4091757.1 hemerythrin domain-containing protein [Nocardia sp. alder85J]
MSIDFTIMYATHDAFRRDLEHLAAAATAGRADAPGVRAGWANFTRQLHVHHTVEDAALWPPVLGRLTGRPSDAALVGEMEAEHAALDPALHAVDEAMRTRSADLADRVHTLTRILTDHMAHEETAALPVIDDVLTPGDWKTFRGAMARKQGPSGAAAYVPWVLDSTTPEQRERFLAAMPGPVAAINKALWERRYRNRKLWAY